MNEVLSHFYMNARKQDGGFYKATTFENMRHAINRYLKDPPFNRKFDIIKDDEFRDANVSFKAALAELKRIGKGSVQHHHPVINESDPISLTSAAALHSAFTSVIGWRTDMHKVGYVFHKVEWNSAGTDIVSTKYNV